jgi:TonB family protein
MKISLACTLSLIVLGQLTPCDAGQKETIPDFDLKWAIPPYPTIEYPYEARRSRLWGTGVYVLDIDSRNGRVIRISIATRSPSKFLDDAALQALMKLRLKPGCPPRFKISVNWQTVGS